MYFNTQKFYMPIQVFSLIGLCLSELFCFDQDYSGSLFNNLSSSFSAVLGHVFFLKQFFKKISEREGVKVTTLYVLLMKTSMWVTDTLFPFDFFFFFLTLSGTEV